MTFKERFRRWRKRGKFLTVPAPYGLERPCQLWQGASRKDKRSGHIKLPRNTSTTVHKYIYENVYGPVKEGLVVRHRCDRPLCCEPTHLEVGTHLDNTHDKVRTGNYHPDKFPCGHDRATSAYTKGRSTRCLICKRSRDKEYHRRRRTYGRYS